SSSNGNSFFSAREAEREWRGICDHQAVKYDGESILIDFPSRGLRHQMERVSAVEDASQVPRGQRSGIDRGAGRFNHGPTQGRSTGAVFETPTAEIRANY